MIVIFFSTHLIGYSVEEEPREIHLAWFLDPFRRGIATLALVSCTLFTGGPGKSVVTELIRSCYGIEDCLLVEN